MPRLDWEYAVKQKIARPLIQMDERSNLIASPTELRGLRYSPELEKAYRLLLNTRQVEGKLKTTNMYHQTFLMDMFDPEKVKTANEH